MAEGRVGGAGAQYLRASCSLCWYQCSLSSCPLTPAPCCQQPSAAAMSFSKDEKKHITDVWAHINPEQVGGDALARLLCVNPWTTRYFKKFGDLSNPDCNANVAHHGTKVFKSIVEAVHHIDNLKGYYADLSVVHSQKFHVDPANFTLFAGIVSIVIALAIGHEYTAQKQAAVEKFLKRVARSLSSGYY